MKSAALTLLTLVGLFLASCPPALADTTVARGQSVVEATVIGENLTLDGTSHGSVTVIDGNLTVGPHGRAEDGVTVIGGHISTAPGAMVNGDVFQLGAAFPHPSPRQLAVALVAFLLVRLGVVWLIWRVALVLGRAGGTQRMFDAARQRPLRAVLIGALITAGLSAATVLCALTVIGVPFALALIGVLLGCGALGCAFVLRLPGLSMSDRRLIVGLLAVPVIGDAVLALATIVGAGALFHHLVGHHAPHPRGVYP